MCGASKSQAESAALSALGEPAVLRMALQRVESAFAFTPRKGFVYGVRTLLGSAAAAALVGFTFGKIGEIGPLLLGIQLFTVGLGITLTRIAPPGMGVALRQLIYSRRGRRERVLQPHLRAAYVYFSVLLWGPLLLAVLPELIFGAGFIFYAIMLPYFQLWFVFGGVGFGLRFFDWIRTRTRTTAALGDGHGA